MSCDAALAFSLHLAMAMAPASANPLTREPLFASIVQTAGALETQADALRHTADPAAGGWASFRTRAMTLSQLDMQGHLELARRGTDGDLKCILRGLAQDLPRKLAEVESAAPAARHTALDELYYLLRDNVETLTAPPQPAV